MGRFDNRIALVTGAASGLGLAISQRLSGEGATVVMTDVDEAAGQSAVASLPTKGLFLRHDVTSETGWKSVVADVDTLFGRLQILVNNAGITLMGDIETLSFGAWKKTLEVDLDGPFLGCQNVIPLMKKSGGVITNISSIAGLRASAALVGYNAAKAAVTLMTKSVALHCAEHGYGIRVNSVHPGMIRTPILEKVFAQGPQGEAIRAGAVATHPIGRIGEPEEVASLVAYLSSDEASFMTGGAYLVDGGATAKG